MSAAPVDSRVPLDSAPGVPPRRAAANGGPRRAAFTEEPELIAACLEADSDARWARRVLRRAVCAVRQQRDYADLNYHAARAAYAAGHLVQAQRLLAAALQINPGYQDARLLAGHVALERGDPHGARAHLAAALATGADYPDVHMLIGDAWRQDGKWKQARQAYRRALELNASRAPARAARAALPSAGWQR
ncbi:MAG: tetratricopeptide repeat protein [Planctomycetota bacterium]